MNYLMYFFSFLCLSKSLFADDGLYQKLKTKYEKMEFYTAQVQSEVSITKDTGITLKGSVFMQKPDKWKIAIYKDQQLLLFNMSDGKSYWKLDKRDKRIIKSKSGTLRPDSMSFFPAFESYDESNINISYSESYIAKLLIPLKNKKGPFKKVELVVDKDQLLISRILFIDAMDKVKMKMTFSKISLKQSGNTNHFNFIPFEEYPVKEIKE